MHFNTLFLATVITSTTFALPAQEPNGATLQKRTVSEGEQSCSGGLSEDKAYVEWNIEIGATYNSDACIAVFDTFKDNNESGNGPSNYHCADNDGLIQLTFDYESDASSIINPSLTSVFPSEGGEYGNINGFNCPEEF